MKRILYIFDNINYVSGARNSMLLQAKYLEEVCDVFFFSLSEPIEYMGFRKEQFIKNPYMETFTIITTSLKKVIRDKDISSFNKIIRILFSIFRKLNLIDFFYEKIFYNKWHRIMEGFDVVIVVSEASVLRHCVSKLKNVKKVQWIHTYYPMWMEYSSWTKSITRNDRKLYHNFDKIIVLSKNCKEFMEKKYFNLSEKIVVIPNLIDQKFILDRSSLPTSFVVDKRKINIITIGRMEHEKNYDDILDICKRLKKDGVVFQWYIIGDGTLYEHIKSRIQRENLSDVIILLGFIKNPYPILRQMDCFILLSHYEGTPVTIDEAAVLGVPVLAVAVGGIPEQIERWKCGRVVYNIEYEGIKKFLLEKKINLQCKKELFSLHNSNVISELVNNIL